MMTRLPAKMPLRAAERAMMTAIRLDTAYEATSEVALRGAAIMMAAGVPADMVVEFLASAGVEYRVAGATGTAVQVRKPKSNGLANPRGVWITTDLRS